MSASSVIRDAMTSPGFEHCESDHDEAAGAAKRRIVGWHWLAPSSGSTYDLPMFSYLKVRGFDGRRLFLVGGDSGGRDSAGSAG